jgi:hypothetical protein
MLRWVDPRETMGPEFYISRLRWAMSYDAFWTPGGYADHIRCLKIERPSPEVTTAVSLPLPSDLMTLPALTHLSYAVPSADVEELHRILRCTDGRVEVLKCFAVTLVAIAPFLRTLTPRLYAIAVLREPTLNYDENQIVNVLHTLPPSVVRLHMPFACSDALHKALPDHIKVLPDHTSKCFPDCSPDNAYGDMM